MMFKAARGSIVLSAMLSGGLAILIRLARAKDASVLGYLTAYVKLALALFVAMRISAVVGFAMGAFVPQSCEPMMAFGGWRCTCCVDGRTDSGGAVFYGVGTEENVGRKDMAWAGYGLRYVGYAGTDGTMPLDA